MAIEHPHFPPVALSAAGGGPAPIGDLYNVVIDAFRELKLRIKPRVASMPVYGAAAPIRDLANAVEALERIKTEGEGLEDSPEEPTRQRPRRAAGLTRARRRLNTP
jgi:hypothetical protein